MNKLLAAFIVALLSGALWLSKRYLTDKNKTLHKAAAK